MSAVHLIPSLFVVIVILAVFWTAMLDILTGRRKSKTLVLGAFMSALLVLQGLAPAALRHYTFGDPPLGQIILPYAWLAGFSALVNPMVVPDLRGLFGESFDYYGSTSHFPPAIWMAYPPVMLVVLLLLTWYALRRAIRQVERWRCADR